MRSKESNSFPHTFFFLFFKKKLGLFPAPNLDWNCYFTSKAGVVQMSRSLGGKMVQAATGGQVRVDCICPSFADTKMVTGDKVRI